MEYEVAILNGGNTPALVKSATLLVRSNAGELVASNPLSKIKVMPALPTVIEKGGILVISFNGPMEMKELYQRGSPPNKSSGLEEFDGEATRKVMIDAHFESMDSDGHTYHAIAGPLTAHITKTKVAGSGYEGKKRSLFSTEN